MKKLLTLLTVTVAIGIGAHLDNSTVYATNNNENSSNQTKLYRQRDLETDPQHEIPEKSQLPLGVQSIAINDNIPVFDASLLETADPFYILSPLDQFGRAQMALGLLDESLMPAESRGNNPKFKPSGWNQAKYDVVPGGWLYNRSHLLGWQLTGNNDFENFITGTRYFNATGMLEYENYVASQVESGKRIVYSVEPIYHEKDLVPYGVQMMGWAQDPNDSFQFNIFVPNEQAGVNIDYRDGSSSVQ